MSDSTTTTKNNTKGNNNNKETYNDVLNDSIKASNVSKSKIRENLDKAIKILRDEGKEREQISKQLKEDWIVKNDLCKRTAIIEALQRAFTPEIFEKAQEKIKEKAEKKKILLAAGGEAIQEDAETGEKVDVSKMSPRELREYYAKKQQGKTMAAASKALQKANVVGQDNFDKEEDEDDINSGSDNNSNNDAVIETPQSEIKNIVIDHADDIKSLILCLTGGNKNKPVIIQFDTATLDCVGIRNGSGTLKQD